MGDAMNLRQEAVTVLRRVEFHLMNVEEGSPTVAAEKVLDAFLDWLDTNAVTVGTLRSLRLALRGDDD